MYRTTPIRVALAAALLLLTALIVPATASAATIVSPVAGAHLEWANLTPIVAFDPAEGETPKWILLADDAEMKTTVRYCRQFVTVAIDGKTHWGCKAWAIGVNSWGQDVLKALDSDHTYFAQVVSTDAAKAEVTGAIQGFTIDAMDNGDDPSDIAAKIWDENIGDGSNLNLGAAAFTNSQLKVNKISPTRVKTNRFRLTVTFTGGADIARSYIRVKSKAGTRTIKLEPWGPGRARGVWVRNARERNLTTQQYSYQAFLRSTTNQALVRSEQRVILIRSKAKKAAASIPAWTPY